MPVAERNGKHDESQKFCKLSRGVHGHLGVDSDGLCKGGSNTRDGTDLEFSS